MCYSQCSILKAASGQVTVCMIPTSREFGTNEEFFFELGKSCVHMEWDNIRWEGMEGRKEWGFVLLLHRQGDTWNRVQVEAMRGTSSSLDPQPIHPCNCRPNSLHTYLLAAAPAGPKRAPSPRQPIRSIRLLRNVLCSANVLQFSNLLCLVSG